MKHIYEKLILRNFKKIPYFFKIIPTIHFEQSNYALIGKLSTSLLHDILTPLTSLSLAQEITNDSLYVKPIITDSTKQISEYVSILRDFLEHASSEESVLVNSEISKCLLLLKHKALVHDIQIQYIEFDQIHTTIYPLHIYQIIVNLISNAIEASTASETKKIILSIRKFKKNFYIECRDYGVGISQDYIEQIGTYNFSTKSKDRGFGLYSVTHIVHKLLKGNLYIESEPGKGSLFSCEIPIT